MVVPHADERPAGARVLQVGIVQVATIDGTVIGDRGRDVKVTDLLAMFVADDVANLPVVTFPAAGLRDTRRFRK